MLITQSTYSSFVPRPFGSPRRSVIYGPRAFEGPRIGRSAAVAWRQDGLIYSVSADPALTTAQLIAIADNTTGG
jgi:hypothetical protein